MSRLVLMATDRGSPSLVGSATLTVMVIDTNDNRPTIPQPWELRVSEGEKLGKVRCTKGGIVALFPSLGLQGHLRPCQTHLSYVLQMHYWAQRLHR